MSEPLLVLEGDDWEVMSEREMVALSVKLGAIDVIDVIDPKTATGRCFALSFYTGCRLVEVQDPAWRPADVRLYFVEIDGEYTRLDGTSLPIHQLNAAREIRITEETAVAYLAFFCFFVRGEEGPFLIVEHPDNGFVPEDPDVRETIQRKARRVKIFGHADGEGWRLSALVLYSNALFFTDFLVGPGGMVHMVEDFPLKADLGEPVTAPLRIEALSDDTGQ